MKYTKYTIKVTTPSGKDYDEFDKFHREDRKMHFSWSSGFLASSDIQNAAEELICEHVRQSHTPKQQTQIRSITIDNSWSIWYVYVEWDTNPKKVNIPTLKFTGTSTHWRTGEKKRRTLHFDFEPSRVMIGALCRGTIYYIEKNNRRVKTDDEDPNIFGDDGDSDGWWFISQKIHKHAEETLKTNPNHYEFQSGFGGDEGSGLIDFCYEMDEPDEELAFPPLKLTWKNVEYVIEFGEVEWAPLIGRKD
jgi:hypothetical protein